MRGMTEYYCICGEWHDETEEPCLYGEDEYEVPSGPDKQEEA